MSNKKLVSLAFILLGSKVFCFSQILTREDSLSAGVVASEKATVLSGYGQAKYQYDFKYQTAVANLDRAVLFIGHKFNSKITFQNWKLKMQKLQEVMRAVKLHLSNCF